MKSIRLILVSAISAFLFNGCAHHVGPHSAHVHFNQHPEYAQPSAIPCYGTGPWGYTIYYGSDAKWHYFEAHHQFILERYKVPRWSMTYWKPVFAIGKARLYVERNAQGELVAVPPKPSRR